MHLICDNQAKIDSMVCTVSAGDSSAGMAAVVGTPVAVGIQIAVVEGMLAAGWIAEVHMAVAAGKVAAAVEEVAAAVVVGRLEVADLGILLELIAPDCLSA
mmetsp:Transcript_14215/g.32245  ORF Transcript_14215/g.32245 Transcript_14215/m.32245 type:complete len:101 (+) Transcript_14215:112-414(+)